MIVISSSNSSSTPLGSGATFTGAGENVSQYSSIRIVVRANSSSPGTLYVGFSSDNSTWVETSTSVANPATQLPLTVNISGTYFRLRYVNGGVAQTTFRIQAEFTETITAGAGVVSGSATVNEVRDVIAITSTMLTNKQFTLSQTPANPTAVKIFPEGGTKQRYGIDFTVSSSVVSWSGLGLDGFLDTSDILEVYYFT